MMRLKIDLRKRKRRLRKEESFVYMIANFYALIFS